MPSRKYSQPRPRSSAHHAHPVHDPVRQELFRRVRGKPSHAGGMMSIPRTFGVALGRVIELGLISLIIMGFLLAGIGGGMLVGYITTAEPISAGMLSNTTETTHIKDSEGNDIAILTGSQNINREYALFLRSRKHTSMRPSRQSKTSATMNTSASTLVASAVRLSVPWPIAAQLPMGARRSRSRPSR